MRSLSVNSLGRARRGLTLIELVLALGLAALLLAAVFQLLESSLSLWRRSETERNLLEQASVVGDLLADDLRELDNTPKGDLLVEWAAFQTTKDGPKDMLWPRLRFVRRGTRAEIARLKERIATETRSDEPIGDQGLIEVVWCITPRGMKPGERSIGVLSRGERLVGDERTRSILEKGWFRGSGLPPAGTTDEVTADLLWVDVLLATQTSIVHDGWKKGDGLEHAATSWDAWLRERPDPTWHYWNQPGAGMPTGVRENPLLPRRIRVELEFERDRDRRRRTALAADVAPVDTALRVGNGQHLPTPGDTYIKVGAEWMRVLDVTGERVQVRRGQRGTQPVAHGARETVHWGTTQTREIPVALYREDWDL